MDKLLNTKESVHQWLRSKDCAPGRKLRHQTHERGLFVVTQAVHFGPGEEPDRFTWGEVYDELALVVAAVNRDADDTCREEAEEHGPQHYEDEAPPYEFYDEWRPCTKWPYVLRVWQAEELRLTYRVTRCELVTREPSGYGTVRA